MSDEETKPDPFAFLYPVLDKAFDDGAIVSNLRSEVRASNLPFCAREYFFHRASKLEPLGDSTFFGDCCMEMGHALHAVSQRFLGLAGILYGNWKCYECKLEYKSKTGPVYCEKCKKLATYEEFEFKHPCGLTGHSDGVMLALPDGTPFRALLEIKGIHPKKLKKFMDKNEPDWFHWVYQANFYLNAVNDFLGLGLEYIVLIYVDRGLPSNRGYFVRKPNRKVYENTVSQIVDAKEKLRLRVIPERICNEPSDGQNLGCVYRHICFLPEEVLKKHIKEAA